MTLPKKHVCQGKIYLLKSKMIPKNKMSEKKTYFTVHFLHLTHKACQILSTFTKQCTVSIFTVSEFNFLTLTPNFPNLFPAIPQHIIISLFYCTECTAPLKNLHIHFQWEAVPWHFDPHWLNSTFIFIGLRTYLNPHRFTVFSMDGVRTCSGFLSCLWSDQSEFMALFMVFNLWIDPGFYFWVL